MALADNVWGTRGDPNDEFNQWLTARGLRRSAGEDGGTNWFRGDRKIIGSPFGEEGRPTFNTANIGGVDYTRLGTDPEAFRAGNQGFDEFSQTARYDPTYGWIAPTDAYNSFVGANNNSPLYDKLFKAAPIIAGAALTAGAASGALGGVAAGATEGATAGGLAGAAGSAAPVMGAGALGSGYSGAGLAGGGFSLGGSAALAPEAVGGLAAMGGGTSALGTGLAASQFAGSVGSPVATGAAAMPEWAAAGASGAAAPGLGGGGNPAPPPAAAPTGSALSRIIDGTASNADWLSVLGTAGATGLGMFAANQQSNSLERLAEQTRAERAPFLNQATGWLNNPDSYWQGPGQASLDANLRRLSASHGNPISSPTALGIASQAGLQDWRNAWSTAGNLGLGGQDIRAGLGAGAAQADANMLSIGGRGLSDILNPPRKELSLADFALLIGGQRA